MQIIVDDHTEMKYYKRCLEQINNNYSQDIEINKCTIIDICDLCIDTLVRDLAYISYRFLCPVLKQNGTSIALRPGKELLL